MNDVTYFHDGTASGTGYYYDGTLDEIALYPAPSPPHRSPLASPPALTAPDFEIRKRTARYADTA